MKKNTSKKRGELKIAEVLSRFADVDAFIKVLTEIGFNFVKKVYNIYHFSVIIYLFIYYCSFFRTTQIKCLLYWNSLSHQKGIQGNLF